MILTEASFWTFIIRVANFKVEATSSMFRASGQILATITVLQLPPILSRKKFVSFACLYGIWSRFLSLKARTTYSRKLSDLLIAWASFILRPVAYDFFVRSQPAKSTKCNFEYVTLSADSTRDRLSMCSVNTVCALDEVAFIAVAP